MTGTLRTVLALLVALSHIPGIGLKYQLGVIAVMIFYFLSGNVMHHSYERIMRGSRYPVANFYLDRFLRIWPPFAVSVLAMVGLARGFKSGFIAMPRPNVSTEAILGNLGVFCMNDSGLCKSLSIVHTQWSLGSEMQFYLVLPLLMVLPFGAFALTVAASLAVHLYAPLAMNPWSAHAWAYGSPYGTLFVFCMGICYARRQDRRYRLLLAAIIGFELASMIFYFPFVRPFKNFFIEEWWLGAVIAAPLVYAAERADVIPASLDRKIGDLSYPIFLTNVVAMAFADIVTGKPDSSPIWVICFMTATAAASFGLMVLVERPLASLRHALSKRLSARKPAEAAVQPAT